MVEVLLDVGPRVVRAEAELDRQFACDPPVRFLVVRWRHDRLAQRDERFAEQLDVELLVALEVGGLGEHDVRPAGDLRRNHVHDDHQVELLDRADGLGLVGHRVDQVRRIDEPALDRVGLAGECRLADARRDRLARKRITVVGVVYLASHRLGVGRVRVARHVHARREVEAALASPAAEQRVQQRNGASALRIVAVPGRAAARVDERRGAVARHDSRSLADQLGRDAGLRIGPLGRARRNLRLEVLEAEAVLLDVLAIVEAFRDDHVHPREQQREVGARLHRQVVLRLARGDREAGVGDDDRGAGSDGVSELLHLRVVHVLAEVRADQHQAAGVRDVGALRRADALAVGELEADVARSAALRERRRGDVRAAVCLERVLQERAADAVAEERHRLGTVLGLDLLHAFGDVAERFVPGDLDPRFLAAGLVAHQRRAQAIRVEVGADAAGPPRAKPSPGQRVVRMARDLPEPAVAHVGERVALPEADVAEGRDHARFAAGRLARHGSQPAARARGDGCGARAEAGDLQEASPRNTIHGRRAVRYELEKSNIC